MIKVSHRHLLEWLSITTRTTRAIVTCSISVKWYEKKWHRVLSLLVMKYLSHFIQITFHFIKIHQNLYKSFTTFFLKTVRWCYQSVSDIGVVPLSETENQRLLQEDSTEQSYKNPLSFFMPLTTGFYDAAKESCCVFFLFFFSFCVVFVLSPVFVFFSFF